MSGTRKEKFGRDKSKTQKKIAVSSDKNSNAKQAIVLVIIAILAAVPFCMGKYFEFNSPGPFDSAPNVYSAKHIVDGARIGIDEIPSAGLGTLLVNMLGVWLFGFNEFGPKLIQGILQAVALVMMFIAMRRLFFRLAAAVGVIVTSVYISSPLIAKFGNVKEQYMIAFMVIGISCFVLYQLGAGGRRKWIYAIAAGAFLSWGPLFKETAASAIGAIGLFVILQPVFKHRTVKQTGIDVLLLLAGVVIAIGPLYVWIIAGDVQTALPYGFVFTTIGGILFPAEEAAGGGSYITSSYELVPFSKQWPRVVRWYGLLILPIALAVVSILLRILRIIFVKAAAKSYERFVLLFAVWWLLDMAFVWISPRSYEQYYLPLNASAAMLGGYLTAIYCDAFSGSSNKIKWSLTGLAGLVCMIAMSQHIFFGIGKSPHSGTKYGDKRNGYAQKLDEINRVRKENLKGAWQGVGDYIRLNSKPTDKMYVWGWYPGIYVQARRFSPGPRAFMMPRPAPEKLKQAIAELLSDFEKERPKFIVDSRKRHIPMERPPFELWPIIPKGFMGVKKTAFLPLNKDFIARYDSLWSEGLLRSFGEDEALRYEAMSPFREFVMSNYRIVNMFGQHVLFELKNNTTGTEQQ